MGFLDQCGGEGGESDASGLKSEIKIKYGNLETSLYKRSQAGEQVDRKSHLKGHKLALCPKIDENNKAFEWKVVSMDCVESDIISSKECLTMTDHQVKNLRNINPQGGVEASGLWGQLAIEFSVKTQEE